MAVPAFQMLPGFSCPASRTESHLLPRTAGPAALGEIPRYLLRSACILRACAPPNSPEIRGPITFAKAPRLTAETPAPPACFQRETRYQGPRRERAAAARIRQLPADRSPAEPHGECEAGPQKLPGCSRPRVRTKRAVSLSRLRPHRTASGFLVCFRRISR